MDKSWSESPWSLAYYGAGAAAGRIAKGLKSHSICVHVRISAQHYFHSKNSLPDGGIFAGRALQSRSTSALSVRPEVASARPVPSPFETALAPSTSALSTAGILHNPAATAASVTLGTSAVEVAAPCLSPAGSLGRRCVLPITPVRRLPCPCSAVCRAPAPRSRLQHRQLCRRALHVPVERAEAPRPRPLRRAASRVVGLVQLAVASGDVVVQMDSCFFWIWYLAHIHCRSVNNRPAEFYGFQQRAYTSIFSVLKFGLPAVTGVEQDFQLRR